MTDPTAPGPGDYGQQPPPGYGQPPPAPPPGYGQAPPAPYGTGSYGTPGYGAPGYGAPQYGGPVGGTQYKGQTLGLPPIGPNSLASQWMRLFARIIDWLILLVPSVVIVAVIGGGEARDWGRTMGGGARSGRFFLSSIVVALLWTAYDVFFLTRSGATPGKSMLGMRVANIADGKNPEMQPALTRSAIADLPRVVPVVGGLFSLVNVLWCLWDPNRQCLHDKQANTVVVNKS